MGQREYGIDGVLGHCRIALSLYPDCSPYLQGLLLLVDIKSVPHFSRHVKIGSVNKGEPTSTPRRAILLDREVRS